MNSGLDRQHTPSAPNKKRWKGEGTPSFPSPNVSSFSSIIPVTPSRCSKLVDSGTPSSCNSNGGTLVFADQCRTTTKKALTSSGKKSRDSSADRYIPNRSAKKSHRCNRSVFLGKPKIKREFDQYLWRSITGEEDEEGKELVFGSPPHSKKRLQSSPFSHDSLRNVKVGGPQAKSDRIFSNFRYPERPTRVLDAVGVVDDFYTDIIDWGSTNMLAVALGGSVYLWDPVTRDHQLVFEMQSSPTRNDRVTNVAWCRDFPHLLAASLCFGSSPVRNRLVLLDTEKTILLNEAEVGSSISSIAWNGKVLTVGSTSGCVGQWNPIHEGRSGDTLFRSGSDKACTLKWHTNSITLAVGSNDNAVRIWDARSTYSPTLEFREHKAAIKALSWCPYQRELIVSGGGKDDKTIHVWNSLSGSVLRSVNARNQIASLEWVPSRNELISCHGYEDANCAVWDYSTLTKTTDLKCHTKRIICSTVSPDACHLATVGADELLCVWQIGVNNFARHHVQNLHFGSQLIR